MILEMMAARCCGPFGIKMYKEAEWTADRYRYKCNSDGAVWIMGNVWIECFWDLSYLVNNVPNHPILKAYYEEINTHTEHPVELY